MLRALLKKGGWIMKLWKKIALGFVGVFVVSLAGLVVTYVIKNQPSELQEPNYFSYYQSQDTKPEGKVGIYISQMILPETYDEEVYRNVFYKPLKIIPWPIRTLLQVDRGTPLYDAERYFEFEAFMPTRLIDHKGRDTDIDGVSYVEKYKAGDIEFVPGKDYTPGYFLFADRKAGMPTGAADLMAKARVFYHAENAGMTNGRVPEEASIIKLVSRTMEKVQAVYGDVPWRWANAEKYDEARAAMYALLDEGVDTVVFSPPRPIYSHYEEFTATVKTSVSYIRDWEDQYGAGKTIKFIIAPQLSDFDVLRDAYLNNLRDQLKDIPQDKSVRVVASFHGMPWEMVENEAWLQLAPPYLNAMLSDIQSILGEEKGFAKWDAVLAQDYFGEMTDMYPSTNDIYWQSIAENYDYVINVPVEFITENTDTLFAHAVVNFQGFDDFDVYEPIDYPDWDQPLIRKYVQDGTTVIYNSVPVGPYQEPLIEAHFLAIDAILSQATDKESIVYHGDPIQ